MFQQAVKAKAKLRLSIAGPSGSGKTYTALALASSLVPDGKVAVVDTENGSASKYADLFHFDVAEMHAPFHPDKYIKAIDFAVQNGYDVIVLDSITHAWNGTGGVLQLKDQFAKQTGYSDYTAWGPAGEIHQRLIDAIVSADIHVIATMRSKMKYAMEEYQDRGGYTKHKPVKVGMGAIQKEGMEYEFDVALDMDDENNAIVAKTRCVSLAGRVIAKPGPELATELADWLNGGVMVDLATVTEIDPGVNGEGDAPEADNPFEDDAPAEPDKQTIIAGWGAPADAMAWAKDSYGTPSEAEDALRNLIADEFAGTLTNGNAANVYAAWYDAVTAKVQAEAHFE